MPRIYCDMVADLFHFGHVRFLRNARENGPKILREQLIAVGAEPYPENEKVELIVGVHHDDDVAKYKRSPVMNMDERAEVILACKYVDDIIERAPLTVTPEYLTLHKIDAVCHAHFPEENDRYAFMYDAVPKGRFIRLDPSLSVSTTDIIARVQLRTSEGTLRDETGSDTSDTEKKENNKK